MRADALLGGFGREDAKRSRARSCGQTSTFLPKIVLTGTKSRIFSLLLLGAGVIPAEGAGRGAPLFDSDVRYLLPFSAAIST